MPPDRRATIATAAHPIVLGAAALIVVNDFVLRVVAPGWWTGKLSDIGWLVVAPVFLAAALAAVGTSGRVARTVGFVVAAGVFVTLQLWPPLGEVVNPRHVADVEDLVCLPALLLAVLAWKTEPAATPASAIAFPTLGFALVASASDGRTLDAASWPCGRGMPWDPAAPLLLQFDSTHDYPVLDSDVFLRGIHLTDGEGRDVPLVAARANTSRGALVCARDGLVGDTEYTWTIGPWEEASTNEHGWEHPRLPTVRFRTLPGEGVAVGDIEGCAALAGALDTAVDQECGIGRWDTGGKPHNSVDTGGTDTDTSDTDSGAAR